MAKNVNEKIAALKAKRDKLGERLNALEQKAKAESRKRDTRQKIIVGGAVIAQMEKDAAFAATIRTLLLASVGRPNDRAAISEFVGEGPAVSPALSVEMDGGSGSGVTGG